MKIWGCKLFLRRRRQQEILETNRWRIGEKKIKKWRFNAFAKQEKQGSSDDIKQKKPFKNAKSNGFNQNSKTMKSKNICNYFDEDVKAYESIWEEEEDIENQRVEIDISIKQISGKQHGKEQANQI